MYKFKARGVGVTVEHQVGSERARRVIEGVQPIFDAVLMTVRHEHLHFAKEEYLKQVRRGRDIAVSANDFERYAGELFFEQLSVSGKIAQMDGKFRSITLKRDRYAVDLAVGIGKYRDFDIYAPPIQN